MSNDTRAEAIAKWLEDRKPVGHGGGGWGSAPRRIVVELTTDERDSIVESLRAGLLRESIEAPSITADEIRERRDWSRETFGPGDRLGGVLDHIRKELAEVEADPSDLSEWVDVILLAMDGAMRQGHEPEALIEAWHANFEKVKNRRYPDWRTMPKDRAIEHIRDAREAPSAAIEAQPSCDETAEVIRRLNEMWPGGFRYVHLDDEHLAGRAHRIECYRPSYQQHFGGATFAEALAAALRGNEPEAHE